MINQVQDKIEWHNKKIELAKAKIEYHKQEIERLNNGVHSEVS